MCITMCSSIRGSLCSVHSSRVHKRIAISISLLKSAYTTTCRCLPCGCSTCRALASGQICIHAHMHTCICAYMYTCIHAHMNVCIHAYMDAYVHTCVYAYMHAYMHICIHAQMHTYTSIHAYMHICIHSYMYTCMHA